MYFNTEISSIIALGTFGYIEEELMKRVLVLIICLSMCLGIPADTYAAENYGTSHPEDLVDKNTGLIRKISWRDEFYGNALNERNWSYDVGGVDNLWGSRQFSYARMENVKVSNGLLDIVSQIQFDKNNDKVITDSEYTGSINSKGKTDFKYGELEIRAKMAPGYGVGSVLYLMGKDKVWPNCGEVDLFQYSNTTKLLTQALFTPKINNTDETVNQKVWQNTIDKTKFHIFKMKWSDKIIQLFIDNILTGTYDPAEYSTNPDPTKDDKAWPFNQPMYLRILGSMNTNISGYQSSYGWTLVKENEDSKDYETHTYVDYVRVYQYQIDKTITNQLNSKPDLYRAYKKKKSKKLKIELFDSGWVNGYEFRIFKTKKNAKKNKKVLVKKKYEGSKSKVKVKNKKLKNKKTLYVRARSYKYCYNVKYYSKWSKPLKVKIKK